MVEQMEPVSLAEVKNLLTKEEKKRELTYEKRYALDHAKLYSKLTIANTTKLVKELCEIERITELHALKICEVLPQNREELQPIFTKERFVLDDDTIKKILKLVSQYL